VTCSTPGCYAKSFRRNLCRNHFYMWDAALTKGSGLTRKESSDVTPTPTSFTLRRAYRETQPPAYDYRRAKPRKPWCLCETPRPTVIALFSRKVLDVEPTPGTPVECATCSMPIREFLAS
jgi:hypothetical protein